jgi:hypothetical protein
VTAAPLRERGNKKERHELRAVRISKPSKKVLLKKIRGERKMLNKICAIRRLTDSS